MRTKKSIMRANVRLSGLLLAGLTLVAACGSGAATPEGALGPADSGDPGGADPAGAELPVVDAPPLSVEGVEPSVAYIVATGTFVDPLDGEQTGSWTGSGFFVDASGTLVTNNHVATGAAFLEVFVNGETEPRTATVVGQDECSDLAVVQVEGDGFQPLAFHTDPFDVGLRVFAAGFPLGDPEYTLTTGIIAKRDADGATSWTSVEEVVQHDARINPGNSGGPLIGEDGRVVGINYAGNQLTDQNFAITAVDAVDIIDRLATGADGVSLGINGQAILLEDGTNGVFVQSIETGGPADRLGIEAGDFIVTVEDVPAAPDGTMAGYCKILRSRGSDQPLKVEVFRSSTGRLLRGTINTDQTLEVIGGGEASAAAASAGGETSTEGSAVIDHGGTALRVPATMVDWEIRPFDVGGKDLLLGVADTDFKYSVGLGDTPSSFDLDGVLFDFGFEGDLEFWTGDAQLVSDLAFFRADGSFITIYRNAEPCTGEPCPVYRAAGARYAVATPAGRLDHVGDGAVLRI
ncbi:MAG: trypsin-like peptidase domain-containing protein [Actinomycetota bacterium]